MSTRWGGKLTSRPLPDSDPTIDALDDDARRVLTNSWLGRSAAERRAADIFTLVHRSLVAVAEQPALIELAERGIDDELRHAELCLLVARRYAGRDVEAPRFELVPPEHKGASEDLRYSLWIVGQCALNETTASAFLEECLEQSTAPLAHAALRELLSDEIDHARIGWAHLAGMSPERRRTIAQWIPAMLAANRREWSKAAAADDDRYAAHGYISRASLAKALESAERDVIKHGLARVGIAS
jgi:hypothetical protein